MAMKLLYSSGLKFELNSLPTVKLFPLFCGLPFVFVLLLLFFQTQLFEKTLFSEYDQCAKQFQSREQGVSLAMTDCEFRALFCLTTTC